jgi:hypothetical protein
MKILEWVATIITIIGAFLTSMDNHPMNLYFLNTGSILWMIWAYFEKKPSIALVNGVMVGIYIFGVIRMS